MASITNIAATDLISDSRATLNTNLTNLNSSKIETGGTNGTPARGDIIVGKNASPTWEKLTIGSAGKILRSDGTDLIYTTLTIPDTAAISTILYASATNFISACSFYA